MLNRRAILPVIILGIVATGAAHAGTAAVSRPSAAAAVASPSPAVPVQAARPSWERLLSGYRMVFGLGLFQLGIAPMSPTIEGIQDGPDSVDPLGVKGGIKGLTPKYQDENPPPTP